MFEVLEHTADIGFRASAGSLAQLFESAAEALVGIAMETGAISPCESYPIEAEGDSTESLLVNWLSEVLYLLDGKRVAMLNFRVSELTPDRVKGKALGEPCNPARHEAKLIIKGVTYHQLRIERTEEGWRCEVFLDI